METQRILMRSLAVVFIASVIWTITVSAQPEERVQLCCTEVSRAKLTDPIIGFKLQKENLPCVKAVIFETERGDFCLDSRQSWVKEKIRQLIKAKRQRWNSTSSSSSSLSEHTRVGGSTHSTESS